VKKIFLLLSTLMFLTIMVVGGWLAYAINSAHMPGPLSQTSIILIERGKGVSAIAQELEDTGVIKSALVFKIYTYVNKDPRPLKAGEYEFAQNTSLADALEMMRAGKVYDRKVTIPEGQTSWQIVERLKGQQDLAGDVTEVPADGTLLPETYHYIKDDQRSKVLAEMKAAMDKTVAELWPARMPDLPFTTEQEMLTLASIVEKETGVAEERKRVAGVFVNRLRRGIPLQSDPTVIYAMTMGEIQSDGQGPIGRRLLTKDLSMESPYNTYQNAGLPPSPIANPGRASIEAVLHPEVHDYIYFVADGSGGHVFARTLEEHNRNVANWRRIRRDQQQ
jgi:UPF0755 protein